MVALAHRRFRSRPRLDQEAARLRREHSPVVRPCAAPRRPRAPGGSRRRGGRSGAGPTAPARTGCAARQGGHARPRSRAGTVCRFLGSRAARCLTRPLLRPTAEPRTGHVVHLPIRSSPTGRPALPCHFGALAPRANGRSRDVRRPSAVNALIRRWREARAPAQAPIRPRPPARRPR
jgi:hypothetical protein